MSAVIKEIALFMMIINIIINILPSEKYVKHIKIISGIVMIIIILNPVSKYMGKGINISEIFERENFNQEINISENMIGSINNKINSANCKKYEDAVNMKIKSDLDEAGILASKVNADVIIQENKGEYAAVLGEVNIWLGTQEDEGDIEVEKVIVGNSADDYREKTTNAYIQKYISDKYELDKKIIKIHN